ncbi:MAG: OmpP1/FadL family transporter [Cellvibrionaceae bacterium]
MKKAIITLCCIVATPLAYSGGYRVSVQGQKALGMGHAGVAMTNSAEAVFFNPGALTELKEDFQLVSGLTLIDTKNRYQNVDTGSSAETDTPLGTPVNFYLAKRYSDKMSFGFGLYTPYGSVVEWEKDWVGSHLINEIDLQSIFLQPTIAYKINDKVSIGGGPIVTISAVELNRNLNTSLQDSNGNRSNVQLEDSNIIDFGFNLGAFFDVSEKVNVGVNYRSEIIVKSEGDADFRDVPGPFQSVFVDGGYTAELPLPAELTLGLTYQVNDRLLLAADYNYTFWDVYEDLTFEFDSVTDPDRAVSVNPRNYKNSSTYRFGMEYAKSDKLTFRTGFYYDQTPIRDGYFAPETPRADSLGFTGGITYKVSKKLALDFSALYLYFDEEDNSYDFNDAGVFEGSYKVRAYALGFGLTYNF